jgi:hypothetical protein
MNVLELLKQESSVLLAEIETSMVTDTIQGIPLVPDMAIPGPEVITPLPEPVSNEALTQQWRNMDLLAMIPLGRRDEAAAILLDDPNRIQILAMCKAGLFDTFTAMEKLGLPDPHLGDLSIRPGPLSEDHIEPVTWTGSLPLFCLGDSCSCFDDGFCLTQEDVPVYKNLNQLRSCPKGNEPLILPCLNCNHHFNGWCKNVPGITGYNLRFILRCDGEIPEPLTEL